MSDELNVETTNTGIDRRSVVKGAAWSVPLIATAVGAPMASASPTGPECSECFAGTGLALFGLGAGAFTGQAIRVGGPAVPGTIVFTGAFGVDATGCIGLLQSFTGVALSASLVLSDGQVLSPGNINGLAAVTGLATDIVSPGLNAFVFTGASLPNDIVGLNYNPRPVQLSITYQFLIVGLPGLIQITCEQTITWNLNTLTSIGTMLPPVFGVGGGGTVNYTGLVTGG